MKQSPLARKTALKSGSRLTGKTMASRVRWLRSDEPDPSGEPRRYTSGLYVRLRWKVAPYEYVERHERDPDGRPVRNVPRQPRIDVVRGAELYRQGSTIVEVARVLGCHHAALSKAFARAGVETRPSVVTRYGEPDRDLIIRLYAEEGLGLQATGRRAGVCTNTVSKVLADAGVPTRRPGRPADAVPSYEAEFQQMRPLVRARSRGVCEAQVEGVCHGRATHVHHRKLRRRGGTNELENLLDVCLWCHVWIHAYPAKSTPLGFLVPSWEEVGLVASAPAVC